MTKHRRIDQFMERNPYLEGSYSPPVLPTVQPTEPISTFPSEDTSAWGQIKRAATTAFTETKERFVEPIVDPVVKSLELAQRYFFRPAATGMVGLVEELDARLKGDWTGAQLKQRNVTLIQDFEAQHGRSPDIAEYTDLVEAVQWQLPWGWKGALETIPALLVPPAKVMRHGLQAIGSVGGLPRPGFFPAVARTTSTGLAPLQVVEEAPIKALGLAAKPLGTAVESALRKTLSFELPFTKQPVRALPEGRSWDFDYAALGFPRALDPPSRIPGVTAAKPKYYTGGSTLSPQLPTFPSELRPSIRRLGMEQRKEVAQVPVAQRTVPVGGRERSRMVEEAQEAITEPRTIGSVLQSILQRTPSRVRKFVEPLRETSEVMTEVKTLDDGVVRQVLSNRLLQINPSVARNTPLGRLVTAYARQEISSEQLARAAVTSAFDAHAERFTGRMGHLLPFDRDGIWHGTQKRWEDVFSRPGDFKLTGPTRALIRDYHQAVDEAEFMRVAAGLPPRAKDTSPEGWFYTPRQVEAVRGLELTGPSNPALQRFYQEATEGYATGITYSNNPRANLELHLRRAYREVNDHMLKELVEQYSVTPQELLGRINSAVVAAHQKAAQAAAKVQLKIRELSHQIRRLEDDLAPKEAQIALADLRKELKAARSKLLPLKLERDVARRKRMAALDTAKKRQVGPGDIFNVGNKEISIKLWRSRFFPKEDAELLKEGIEELSRELSLNPIFRGVEVLGNSIRFLSTVGDFAMPMIQGQPILAARPLVWARMALMHYQAFFEPTVQAKLIRKHLSTFHKMARHGIPIGDPEFFAVMELGRGIPIASLIEKVPYMGVSSRALYEGARKQTFGRFQASYNTGLGMARALLWESLEKSWKGTDAELAQYIRNLTGGLDSRALGVGPDRRAVESMWLAFSPRLLRSTVALVGDAVLHPNTPVGRASLQTLAKWAAAAHGMFVLTGIALGKDWDEIAEGLNPLSGKRYLKHDINGDWIGVGGQLRAITQFIASMASTFSPNTDKTPKDLMTNNPWDNPLIAAYMSRGAVGYNIVGGAVEAFTDLDVLPYDKIDGRNELLLHLGRSALPFAIQGLLEGQSLSLLPFELSGFSVTSSKLDKAAHKLAGVDARTLGEEPFMADLVRSEAGLSNDVSDQRAQQLLAAAKDPWYAYRDMQRLENRIGGMRSALAGEYSSPDPRLEDPDLNIRALAQRNALYDDQEVAITIEVEGEPTKTGRIDWTKFEEKLAELNFSPSQKEYILRNTNRQPIPMNMLAPNIFSESGIDRIMASYLARLRYLKKVGLDEVIPAYRAYYFLEERP